VHRERRRERDATLLDGAGIPVIETLSWNAYP